MFWQKKLALLLGNHLPFSLDCLPSTACLVGGAVRDTLLDRALDYLDLDFVLPELAVEVGREIAHRYKAGFVVLDEQRRIARVIFKQGTVDFAQQEGDSLEKDLRRRDFTVNAIAYNPRREELIDPLGGLVDLKKRSLRMVSQTNLCDDPLRLLRAYRQAAQLNFSIDEATRATIRQLAPRLSKIAAERVQNELGYLLANPRGTYWLTAAWEDGLLQSWLKNVTAEKLQQIDKVEYSASVFSEICARHAYSLAPETIETAKLANLVSFAPEEAELELVHLKYPRATVRTITTSLKYLPQLQRSGASMNLREQYFFFLGLGDVFPPLALLALARGVDLSAIAMLAQRYFDPNDSVAHPKSIVKGNTLIDRLGIPPSPMVGKLLTELQIAFIEGKIATVDEALQLARILSQMSE
ncbi:MAG: CCA tRNA nucleotidyltransferase [Hydrococcus sp. CRU_1_1]|nr:CCA tRNA nucleotidyltransferase [Hydrococcus sp. CRU_1_1]